MFGKKRHISVVVHFPFARWSNGYVDNIESDVFWPILQLSNISLTCPLQNPFLTTVDRMEAGNERIGGSRPHFDED